MRVNLEIIYLILELKMNYEVRFPDDPQYQLLDDNSISNGNQWISKWINKYDG